MAHEEAQPKGHSQQTLALSEVIVMPPRLPDQEGFLSFFSAGRGGTCFYYQYLGG